MQHALTNCVAFNNKQSAIVIDYVNQIGTDSQ